MMNMNSVAAAILLLFGNALAFAPFSPSSFSPRWMTPTTTTRTTISTTPTPWSSSLLSSSTTEQETTADAGGDNNDKNTRSTDILSVSLTKPLGLVLEEVQEGAASGVYVTEIGDAGSAAAYIDEIKNCPRLLTVQGTDVTALDFEAVMDTIGGVTDATVDLTFGRMVKGVEDAADVVVIDDLPVGTVVTVTAEQKDQPDLVFDAKVGDNLRQALLDNGFEVYQGMKQKLGNCSGGGTCTFCAVEILEQQGWPERSDYENQRLKKNPQARLACLNPIQGPVTLRKMER